MRFVARQKQNQLPSRSIVFFSMNHDRRPAASSTPSAPELKTKSTSNSPDSNEIAIGIQPSSPTPFSTRTTPKRKCCAISADWNRDLSLTTSMIPLGSCIMKLNATAEMFPISWPSSQRCIRSPDDQTADTARCAINLDWLAETGLAAVSPSRTPARKASMGRSRSANITRHAAKRIATSASFQLPRTEPFPPARSWRDSRSCRWPV